MRIGIVNDMMIAAEAMRRVLALAPRPHMTAPRLSTCACATGRT
jgi:hypothetical protein